jgi:hypothetical protein
MNINRDLGEAQLYTVGSITGQLDSLVRDYTLPKQQRCIGTR